MVIGGPDSTVNQLKSIAGPKTKFLGKAPFSELKSHMARCKALIFPGEEDFGIVPVEVMASGRPVIAYGRGGALDTVVDGETGLFFKEQSVEALIDAVERFEASGLDRADPATMLARSRLFTEEIFMDGIERSLKSIGA